MACDSQGKWYIAKINQNCDDACQAVKKVCSEKQLDRHNVDVDTSQEVLELVRKLGGTIGAIRCSSQFGTSPDVPYYSTSGGFCSFSKEGRTLSQKDLHSGKDPKTIEVKRKKKSLIPIWLQSLFSDLISHVSDP